MNKKVLFTCVLLVLLAAGVAGCKLPASGSPPTAVSTGKPGVPTATTGIAAEPTQPSAPPTAVLVTVTPLPPTAVPPPTQEPPTPVPPPPPRLQLPAGSSLLLAALEPLLRAC